MSPRFNDGSERREVPGVGRNTPGAIICRGSSARKSMEQLADQQGNPKVAGSSPACGTMRMVPRIERCLGSKGPPKKLPACSYHAGRGICRRGVVAAPLPSKQIGPVRTRSAAPDRSHFCGSDGQLRCVRFAGGTKFPRRPPPASRRGWGIIQGHGQAVRQRTLTP